MDLESPRSYKQCKEEVDALERAHTIWKGIRDRHKEDPDHLLSQDYRLAQSFLGDISVRMYRLVVEMISMGGAELVPPTREERLARLRACGPVEGSVRGMLWSTAKERSTAKEQGGIIDQERELLVRDRFTGLKAKLLNCVQVLRGNGSSSD